MAEWLYRIASCQMCVATGCETRHLLLPSSFTPNDQWGQLGARYYAYSRMARQAVLLGMRSSLTVNACLLPESDSTWSRYKQANLIARRRPRLATLADLCVIAISESAQQGPPISWSDVNTGTSRAIDDWTRVVGNCEQKRVHSAEKADFMNETRQVE